MWQDVGLEWGGREWGLGNFNHKTNAENKAGCLLLGSAFTFPSFIPPSQPFFWGQATALKMAQLSALITCQPWAIVVAMHWRPALPFVAGMALMPSYHTIIVWFQMNIYNTTKVIILSDASAPFPCHLPNTGLRWIQILFHGPYAGPLEVMHSQSHTK